MPDSFKQDLTATPARKKATKKAVSSFFFAILFFFMPVLIESFAVAYHKYAIEATDVFVYYSLKPKELNNSTTKPLTMVSDKIWYMDGGHTTQNDVLRCEVGGIISEQTTHNLNHVAVGGTNVRGLVEWQYNGKLPTTANICSMRSTIRYCFDHLYTPVCKQQTVTSEPILFVQ